METKQPHTVRHTMTIGAYLGVALTLYSLLITFTGLDKYIVIQFLYFLFIVGGITASIVLYRRGLDEPLIFKKAFAIGFYTVAFSAIITGFYNYLYIRFTPGASEGVLKAFVDAMPKTYTPEQTQELMAFFQNHVVGMYVAMNIMSSLMYGALFSAVIAFWARKR